MSPVGMLALTASCDGVSVVLMTMVVRVDSSPLFKLDCWQLLKGIAGGRKNTDQVDSRLFLI